jgi:hypothetical protein
MLWLARSWAGESNMSIIRGFTLASVSLAFALTAFSTPAMAGDLELTLNNRSSFVVVEFYASPSDVGDWEEDILGADVLGSGESIQITVADGRTQCDYDLRFVFDDGDVVDKGSVDLCKTGSYTLTD